MARDMFSIIPHSVGLEASYSFDRDVNEWRLSKTTGKTRRKKVVVRQFALVNHGILARTEPTLDTQNTEND